MNAYRVTKYNPAFRNEKGYYTKDEWTAISDIGMIYDGKTFTVDEYKTVEQSYVDAVLYCMKRLNIADAAVCHLEKPFSFKDIIKRVELYSKAYTDDMIKLFKSVRNNDVMDYCYIDNILKLVLREDLWCALRNPNDLYVRTGWDYYMYISCNLVMEDIAEEITRLGLFIEPFEPYWDEKGNFIDE